MARRLPQITVFLSVFTIFFLMLNIQAYAKTTKEEAQSLETIFKDMLGQYEDAAKTHGATLMREGQLMVEPSDSYYAVTLPHLSLKLKDGSYTEIGMISINALPGDTDEQWKMTVALPTPVIHYGADNKPVLTANISSQSFAGIWHKKLKNFIKINAQYKDISIKHHTDQTRIIIPNTRIIYDLKENKQHLWSGPADFKVSDFQMYFDRDNSRARIKELAINSTIYDYSIDAALDYQEKIGAIAESYEGGDEPSASGPHVIGLYNLIADFMGNAWDGFDFTISLKDLTLTTPSIPGSPAGLLKIGNGAFGFNMNGFHAGAVNMGLRLAYNGFEFAPITEEYNQATPDHINFDLSMNNLPYKEIIDLGRTSIQGSMQNPAASKFVGLQAIMVLPQLLTQAQTNITLKDTVFGNKQYNVLTNGALTADISAKMGLTGSAKTEIFGLDDLIEALSTASSNPDIDDGKQKSIKDSLSMLAIVKMVGQIEKDKAGRDIRAYNLEFNKEGQALLNGTDLQMLLQATQGAAPAQ